MREFETRASSTAAQKSKIRERYKGVSADELDVIPALPQEDFYEDVKMKRVAVYARVSTDDPRQTSSYELQKNHYEDVVSRRPNWQLVEIYADEGISGTSLQHRDSFIRMIDDCKKGKIDLIVTKSVSRFARNVVDCIKIIRDLKAMNPPIGVFFETENIYTLNSNSEMSLSFISTLAQEESHNKSEIMNASIEMRFRRGIFLTPPLLGYDQDENGDLVINEEEAKTVRLIFFMYLYGYSTQEISDTLMELKRPTKKGNYVWSPTTVLAVLQNERHCGDVLARKTWTPSYLDHKSKKNRQDRNQYRQRNHHEAIVSRDDFIAVQHKITNSKYGNKSILPELKVIDSGVLKGFVTIHPRWAGFKVDDYKEASFSAYKETDREELPAEASIQPGAFDLRGYEIARTQFFDVQERICVTFSNRNIVFSTAAVRKFGDCMNIELLVHPENFLLAVRPCSAQDKISVQWARKRDGILLPKSISGNAFLPPIFEMFQWNKNCKYKIVGVHRQRNNESILVFNLKETEVLLPNASIIPHEPDLPAKAKEKVMGYPQEWVDNFGSDYYTHTIENEKQNDSQPWDAHTESKPYRESEWNVSSEEELHRNINEIITEMKQEATND